MSATPRTVCDCCGRPMKKAQSIVDGKGYCAACYKREFKQVACSSCGRTTRILNIEEPAICKTCRTKDRSCLRCGKPVPHAALVMPDGVACPSCARYFKDPKACPACGQLSLHLSRDYPNGYTEPVCERCRRKGHITCPACGKHRKPAGTTSDGRLVCEKCLAVDGKPYICPRCGHEGKIHDKNRCISCYWQDRAMHKLTKSLTLFTHDWSRDAFKGFVPALFDRIGTGQASIRFEHYFLFFARLDAAYADPATATASSLIGLFGKEGLRRFAVPYGYLVKIGLLPSAAVDEIEDAGEARSQQRLLQRAEGKWYHEHLVRFCEHWIKIGKRYAEWGWTGKKRRYGPATATKNMRAANVFLTFLEEEGLTDLRQLDQYHLDKFVVKQPGYRNGIRAFVRFIKHKYKFFRKFKVETVRRDMGPGMIIPERKYRSLLKEWLTADDDLLKESVIGVFLLLYAQTITKTVKIKLDDLRQSQGLYLVKLGAVEVPLAERFCGLMDRYLIQRKAIATMEDDYENEYLFTGRTFGSHLTEEAVSYHLKKWGVTAEQCFSSAIFYAYQSGMNYPKAMAKGLGISSNTAVRYLEMLNLRAKREAAQVVNRAAAA